ncbi:MAG: Fpg/Nei family DNA glycosylase [Sandaracinaceae bacterium]
MPEGDTIHRAARTLQRAIGGREVTRFSSVLPELEQADLAGRQVREVTARGKNLLVHFDDGRVLHTHMRMEGSWHIYRPGEPWRKRASGAHAVLETDDWVAVCFHAPLVELLASEDHSAQLRGLGPDLLDPDVDLDEAVRRLRGHGHLPIGEAVMRQQLVAGIGNVYKSETLFLLGLDPFRPVAESDDATLREALQRARALMKQNLRGFPRVTRRGYDGQRLWVYGRQGKACFRCRTPIRMRRQGTAGRSTYWCPACQPSG